MINYIFRQSPSCCRQSCGNGNDPWLESDEASSSKMHKHRYNNNNNNNNNHKQICIAPLNVLCTRLKGPRRKRHKQKKIGNRTKLIERKTVQFALVPLKFFFDINTF